MCRSCAGAPPITPPCSPGIVSFWTAVPLLLAGPRFGWTQQGIGLFALAGAIGAVAAPTAGRIADRGWTRSATAMAIGGVLVAFALALAGGAAGSIPSLLAAAVLLDMSLAANFVISQRAIYATRPESRSRLNGLFTAMFFAGGAAGSALAGVTYADGGWTLTCLAGMSFAATGLFVYGGELLPRLGPPAKAARRNAARSER
jgi:MFS family permease